MSFSSSPTHRAGTLLVATALVAGVAAAAPASAALGSHGKHHGQSCRQPGGHRLPQGSRPVHLDPADFTTRIDNPYWPMRPGTTWRYTETSGGETARVTITVTNRTRVIQGVTARVVHDSVRSGGELVEDTYDWYAQDKGGSIWYLGEATKTFENGQVVSTEGSWEHGKDGAQAGVAVPARPVPDCGYREEYRAGVAEDQARVLSTREPLRVGTTLYRNVLHTANTTPLHADLLENKFYARGLGPVMEVDLSPEIGTVVLTGVTHP
ncbi:hypothetical protein [Phycicoccus avicenniae]|uniref:hypothetical protein n=1 Tax=Phycicoccus avicenniae TaxID=2828860 RepID=UPI003D2D1447